MRIAVCLEIAAIGLLAAYSCEALAPIAVDTSVRRVELYPGIFLKVPKKIWGLSEDSVNSIKADYIYMVLQYPDMTPGWDPSTPEKDFQKQDGKYKPQPDRFHFAVDSLFYSPGNPGDQEDFVGPDPRPIRIEYNLHCKLIGPNNKCMSEMQRVPSGVAGIDALISRDWLKKHPDDKNVPSEGGSYVAKQNATYELWMACDDFTGIDCKAYVFIKKNHLQYKVLFPPEAVYHVDDLIQKYNKTLESWLVVKENPPDAEQVRPMNENLKRFSDFMFK